MPIWSVSQVKNWRSLENTENVNTVNKRSNSSHKYQHQWSPGNMKCSSRFEVLPSALWHIGPWSCDNCLLYCHHLIIPVHTQASVVKGISDASCTEPDFCEFSFLVVGLQSNLSQVAASASAALASAASLVTHWKIQHSQQIKREVWIVIIIIMKSHCIFSPQKQKGQSGGRTVETPALRQLSGQKRASASIRCSQFSLSLICCWWLFSAVYFQMISQNATTISSTLPTQIKRRRLIRSSASLGSQQNHLLATGSTLVFLFTNCILTEWTAWLKI